MDTDRKRIGSLGVRDRSSGLCAGRKEFQREKDKADGGDEMRRVGWSDGVHGCRRHRRSSANEEFVSHRSETQLWDIKGTISGCDAGRFHPLKISVLHVLVSSLTQRQTDRQIGRRTDGRTDTMADGWTGVGIERHPY